MTHVSARNNDSFAIIDHENEFYQEQLLTCRDENVCLRKFPNILQIYDGTVDIEFTAQKEGIFSSVSISC